MQALRDRLCMDYFKREILKTTYGTRPGLVSLLDPRTLFLWYLFFAVAPWFFFNRTILIGMALIVIGAALLTRVSGLILFLVGFGLSTQFISLMITILIFGGDLSAFWSISTLILKLMIVSLASVAAFAGLDPEKLSDGLMAMGLPVQIAFSVSYAFRIIPVLIDEYQSVFHGVRLRSHRPEKAGFLGFRLMTYWFRIIMKSFYPMMLNTAKRTRSTVESLEIRGFTWSLHHGDSLKLRFKSLGFGYRDALWALGTISALLLIFSLGIRFPL
ncbi:MAG: energy-coupling factor transporter transmembrane component T [Spirochaetales bacterium]|nr:energy-coupling factor transporter transmembrane component T [Spirochaetales bacterium]